MVIFSRKAEVLKMRKIGINLHFDKSLSDYESAELLARHGFEATFIMIPVGKRRLSLLMCM